MDYLVTMTTHVPDGVTQAAITAVREREAAHTAELARAGNVLRLWRPPLRPGEWRTLGLFATDNDQQLEQILAERTTVLQRTWRSSPVALSMYDTAVTLPDPSVMSSRAIELASTATRPVAIAGKICV